MNNEEMDKVLDAIEDSSFKNGEYFDELSDQLSTVNRFVSKILDNELISDIDEKLCSIIDKEQVLYEHLEKFDDNVCKFNTMVNELKGVVAMARSELKAKKSEL